MRLLRVTLYATTFQIQHAKIILSLSIFLVSTQAPGVESLTKITFFISLYTNLVICFSAAAVLCIRVDGHK